MNWQPSMDWQIAKQRAAILSSIRAFFADRGVIEVETPMLSHGTITDVHLEAISARFDHSVNGSIDLYMQTSPEFAMKRLLASGYQSIFQISKAFRNEPQGRIHNPEFTMLEWYRVGFSMHELIAEVSDLLCLVFKVKEVEILSYQQAFIAHTNVDPLETNISSCLSFIENNGKQEPWLIECNCLDTLLQFIFCEFIENKIGTNVPCFIHSFPASQASLANLNEKNPKVANRFECYYKGIELVNGFDELTDVVIQKQRFEADNGERTRKGLPTKGIDQRFIQALEQGLPKCSGVALGIDRLVMLALHKTSINEVMTFTTDLA